MKYQERGFSLLELMTAVAILGVLTAIAFPTYQDYSSKTQIYFAYQAISVLKVPVDLKLIQNEGVVTATELGWVSGSSPLMLADPVVSVDPVTGLAHIEATLDGRVNSVALGVKVKVARDGNGKWVCTIKKTANAGWKDHFAPASCTVIP